MASPLLLTDDSPRRECSEDGGCTSSKRETTRSISPFEVPSHRVSLTGNGMLARRAAVVEPANKFPERLLVRISAPQVSWRAQLCDMA
eukprot:1748975-Amphidinium_carterae.1